jgi:hypothetical protein
MLKVVFCADGQPVNDFYACDFVDSKIFDYIINGRVDMETRFSTESVLDAFVLRVMEGRFPMTEIEFFYRGPNMVDTKMEFNEFRGLKVPDGVNEIGTRSEMVRKIVQTGFEKIKTKAERKSRKDT